MPQCGNNIIEGQEQCDDGSVNGEGCRDDCSGELPGWDCVPSGQGSACSETCGNGITTVSEQCDDGNSDDTDGCLSDCTIDPEFSCLIDQFGRTHCGPPCGDGIITEECDDHNRLDGDGCSSSCVVEDGASCEAN